jgi:GT2 family glycosyltransferase
VNLSEATAEGTDDSSFVSVIIVTFNSAAVIHAALTGARTHLPGAEIIVVDNGSTDDTCDLVTAFPGIRLISGHGNVGFGAGVNVGARAARGKILLVHNPDAVPTSVDRAALSRLAETTPFGMVGCRLHESGHTQHSLHVAWGWRKELSWSLAEWYLVPREVKSFRPRPRKHASTWVSGAAFLVDRDEFMRVGGFDERLFLYYEDFDLSRAYTSRGLPHRSTTSVTLKHMGRSSSPRNEDVMMAWALMSLIEQTAKWDGTAAAHTAARWAWRQLGVIETVGHSVGRIPWIGVRGRQKAASAANVRAQLRRAATVETTEVHYPVARAALRAQMN